MPRVYCWDWKYKLYFDTDLRKNLEDFLLCLTDEEQTIYRCMLSFYTSFYSFGILLDEIEQKPEKMDELIHQAVKYSNDMISTPGLILGDYQKRISALKPDMKKEHQLLELLELSLSGKSVYPEYLNVCQTIYGALFPSMVEQVREIRDSNQKIFHGISTHGRMKSIFYQEYQNNLLDSSLISRFGPSAIGDFDVRIEPGAGFAEWWDREISDIECDQLKLFLNEDADQLYDFIYTIYHETYPGHGHFYNMLLNDRKKVFDHGAMSLIEGWATYAEWNSKPSEYITAVRTYALLFLKDMLLTPDDQKANTIFKRKKMQGYSEEECRRCVGYATQYIGFLESYYWGALWFEQVFDCRQLMIPKEFLQLLSKKNCVEGFSSWVNNIT